MGKGAIIVFLAGIVLVPPSVLAEKQSPKETPLHHFQLPCVSCHDPESADPNHPPQERDNVGEVKGDINRLCTASGCHNFDSLLNHPVGIKPKTTIPRNMPLDRNSRITCLTCHDKPGSSDNTDEGRERSLHLPQGVKFCSACHTRMGGTLVKQSHWQFSTRAHLISKKSRFPEPANFQSFSGNIDPESRSCLSCHDNVTVTIPPQNETTRQKKRRWRKMTDHPIGMEYRSVALRKMNGYKFPLMGDKIRLFNGRVGCGSCHSLYAQTKNNLIDRYERGVLCRGCHNK